MTMRPVSKASGRAATAAGFYDFYGTRYASMVRLARGLVDTSECAEEIVQDSFIKVFERWDRLDEPAAYLRAAVVNGAAASFASARYGEGSDSGCVPPALRPRVTF